MTVGPFAAWDASAVPSLDAGAVQVWVAVLAPDIDGPAEDEVWLSDEWLSEAERERAARAAPARRREFVAGRRLLRGVCAAHLRCAPAAVPLTLLPSGKPMLASTGDRSLELSLAHTGDVILLAVSRAGAVGVDVERVGRSGLSTRIAARFFSPSEHAALERLSADERPSAFTRCWARKEAMVKAIGTGIAGGLSTFEVPVHAAPTVPVVWAPEDWGDGWTLRDLPVPKGYLASLALRGAATPVTVLRVGP